ncbi:MAG: hypothetical protein HYX82_06005, partial [Chloroflexi bacterium]|nr:hypothetical protein [Chloroflexota bacterium]
AAGFVTLDENLFKTLADAMENEEIKNALPALSMARLDYLAFAAYSDKPLKLPEEIKLSDLKESGLRAILVGRAGYPSFLLDLLFGNIVQRFGLEEVSFEAGKAYHIAQGDLHLAAKNNGNHIYVVAATSKEKALELLTSAFK